MEHNVASICVPCDAVPTPSDLHGARGQREDCCADVVYDGATSKCVPRGGDVRRRDEGTGRPALQQQPVGDLDADAKQTAVENLVDKAIGYGIPVRVDGGDVSRSMR